MTKDKEVKATKGEVPGASKTGDSETLFYIHELREHSRELFDVKPEVLDGVFARTKEIQVTKGEAKRRIDKFLKKTIGKKKEVKK